MASPAPAQGQAVVSAEQKYCSDCGNVILRRAEICPKCGCRQLSAPVSAVGAETKPFSIKLPNADGILPMMSVIVGNLFWAGLGNLLVGNKEGWKFGLLTWIFVVMIALAAPIGAIGYFVWMIYCDVKAYEFLQKKAEKLTAQSATSGTPS
jgi:hypothetical protein